MHHKELLVPTSNVDYELLWQKPSGNKVSSMFGGTRDKCVGCKNTVYPTEKVNIRIGSHNIQGSIIIIFHLCFKFSQVVIGVPHQNTILELTLHIILEIFTNNILCD